ncbi:flagellin, partial [Saccharibacillus endophyticus]
AMNEVSSMLGRMKELNVQKANGTYGDGDKSNINAELNALGSQIDSIMTKTTFNGININKTTGDSNISIQADDSSFTISINKIDTTGFSGLKSATTLTQVSTAIEKVATQRANLGAVQNRLEYTSNNLGTTVENLTASESRIRDTDMAKEMVALSKNNILLQASQSMLAQANQSPQGVLSLLR